MSRFTDRPLFSGERLGALALLLAITAPSSALAQDDLKINEIYIGDPTEPRRSWIELHNPTNRTIEHRYIRVTDGLDTPLWQSFPIVLPPGAFYVIGHSDAPEADTYYTGRAPGRGLSATYAFRLIDADARVLDTVLVGGPNLSGWIDDTGAVGTSFGPTIPYRLSVGRIPDGRDTDRSGDDIVVLPYPSPGRPNGSDSPPCDHGGGARGVVINEIYLGDTLGDASGSWIELYNASPATVDLARWTLRTDTAVESVAGGWSTLTIEPGAFVLIGGAEVRGRDATLAEGVLTGDRASSAVRLVDCSGATVDTVVIGAPNTLELRDDTGEIATRFAPRPAGGISVARRSDGIDTDDSAADFVLEREPTPRGPNRVPTCVPGRLVINEIRPGPSGEIGGAGWVELFNGTQEPVFTQGFVLDVDREAFDGGVPLPAHEVPPGGYVVLGPPGSPYAEIDLPFLIPFAGTQTVGLQLRDCEGAVLDTVLYGSPNRASLPDDGGRPGESLAPDPSPRASIARTPNGRDTDRSAEDFRVEFAPTPGAANREPTSRICDRAGRRPVLINEVSAWPFFEGMAWVELYNPSESAWRLDGWTLAATTPTGEVDRWEIPAPLSIEPYGFVVIGGDASDVSDARIGLELPDGAVATALILHDCAGDRVDTVLYGPPEPDQLDDDRGESVAPFAHVQTPGATLARREDGRDTDRAIDWIETWTPTPGAPNEVPLDLEDAACGGCASGGTLPGAPLGLALLLLVVAARRRATPIVATLALGACGDRSVSPIVEPTPPDGPTSCDETWADYEPVDEIVSCGMEPGWSEPRLRWFLPGYTPIGAGPLIDTDGDGRVTIHDESMIFARSRDDAGLSLYAIDGRGVVRAMTPRFDPYAFFDAADGSGYRVYGVAPFTSRVLVGWRPGAAAIEIGKSDSTPGFTMRFGSSGLGRVVEGGTAVAVNSYGRTYTLDGVLLRPPLEDPAPGGHATPVLLDEDGDGSARITLGGGILGPDFETLCVRDEALTDLTVIDLHGDGRPVTIGVVGPLPLDYTGPLRNSQVHLFDGCRRGAALYLGHGGPAISVYSFAVGDVTGDGRSEIIILDGRAGVTALRPDGRVVWHRPTSSTAMARRLTLADLRGDGALEIVLDDGIILDGATGATLAELATPSAELEGDLPQRWATGAMVVDLEGDGHAQIILSESQPWPRRGISVFDGARGWAPGPRCAWSGGAESIETLDAQCRLRDRPRGPEDLPTTFRVAHPPPDAPRTGGELAVRFADLCERECDQGRLRAIVQVGNLGSIDIDRPVEVQLIGSSGEDRVLLGTEILPFVPAATWLPGIEFQMEIDGELDDLAAEVRPSGWRLRQCDETDDIVWAGFRLCREAR